MSYRKVSRITNLWSKVMDGEKGEWLSKVVVESTRPYTYDARKTGNGIELECKDVIINMPEGTTKVNDGLLRETRVKTAGEGSASVEIVLDHPAEFRIKVIEGFPFRLEVTLDRSFITGLFSGKKIAVDPGHGGNDTGGKGPVSLLEKDVVLPIARDLENILRRAGAEIILTRSGDEELSRGERYDLAKRAGADVYIGIHNLVSADCKMDGIATLYGSANGRNATLARYVQEGLVKKLKANDRGIVMQPELDVLGEIPAIEAEILAITNLVEEVFLRGLTVRKKAAEGILNGLIKYFAPNGASA